MSPARAIIPTMLALSLLAGPSALAAQEPSNEQPTIVVTTEVLGSIVRDLAADEADVTVLMTAGADPHSWQPSARDSQALFEADVIVANGLDLEEGLIDLLGQAETEGVPVFRATDHVAIRMPSSQDHEEEADDEDQVDQEHASGDPHFWLDPLAMRDVVLALGAAMAEAGIDVADRASRMAAELETLDDELATMLEVVPIERRQLVTGHEALGYFADRYGFDIVGTVIPGLSSSDEPSARDIAELIDSIRAAGATAVFTDVSTPASVAEAVAAEAGVQIVQLKVEQLPESGSYADLLRQVAASVAEALSS
ncbi:MAG TPA: metal ABC transporter substrate-binding protein [Candidatus Limnocylindrales bacterium]|nr:metal ABC transporter substrate-binding protein [Candidatus Limnocylindrales bacterium]